jgi:dinuclear metal center YbgI/SA1388 family protein
MKISEVIDLIETWAPPQYAEEYDNVGLITGNSDSEITGILICLDSLEITINEAKAKGCNLIIAHHPIIFKGLKKINGANYVQRTIIQAIKNEIGIYALHTNLDNIASGVNKKIADKLNLDQLRILSSKNLLPPKSEIIGSGIIGQYSRPLKIDDFLGILRKNMELPVIKHTVLCKDQVSKVAICGGSGSFLIPSAIKEKADVFITSDLKYHEFFDADAQMILMDIGHYESEKFTIELIEEYLLKFLPANLINKTAHKTNPVQYFI